MAQKIEEVHERLDGTLDPITERDEILRRAGVSIPTGRNMAPFRAVPRRPRWLAFIVRVFGRFFPEPDEMNEPGDRR